MLVAWTSIFALATFASAAPTKRELAQVITQCTVPDTAALTFMAKTTIVFTTGSLLKVLRMLIRKATKSDRIHGAMLTCPTSIKPSSIAVVAEFARTEDALKKVLGIVPAFTRCPYGEYNDLVRQVAYDRGQTLVNWDFDSGDSVGKTPKESNDLYDDVANEHPSTLLALNHEMNGTLTSMGYLSLETTVYIYLFEYCVYAG
ncbi:hypothetical protein C0995_009546 [Termitomyces sp. Mi166|nr:hypothetical protein C0995_009546 [Termitomyces sp. Mi166\